MKTLTARRRYDLTQVAVGGEKETGRKRDAERERRKRKKRRKRRGAMCQVWCGSS